MTKKRSISVCITTCLRPKGLSRLLDSLMIQEGVDLDAYTIRIVVIDNDSTGENETICARYRANSPWEIVCVEEPVRGIPYARNKAVEESWNDDAMIFVDDDEWVPTHWLHVLLKTWQETGADIVTGPVKPELSEGAPQWAIKSKTYEDGRKGKHKTGDIVQVAYTNNTLVSQAVLHAVQPAFSTKFRYTGSEDIHYFQRAVLQGFKIAWCQEAEVTEFLPLSRLKISWLIKRSFRNGSGDAMTRVMIHPRFKTYVRVFSMASGRCAYGIRLFFKGMFLLNWVTFIWGLKLFMSGVGTYAGLLGLNYQEYKKIHGD